MGVNESKKNNTAKEKEKEKDQGTFNSFYFSPERSKKPF